ncbi:S41 family peptidase [Dysgonomonas sp. ZJ279]|uniref:S41 family peptidase n=1 Tax=Dysgonomonas sp. ZJ279 TaxID=2709796 RepID=UPI0013EA4E8F|nr:S41 family peptidase [Dysgonomonas sp. ZJ279]
MKKSIILIFALFIQIYGYTQSNNISYPQINTQQDKLFGLSKVWSEIKYNFVNIDRIDFDLDSLYNSTIPIILNTTNDIEYYDALQRFIASFNDGHTELIERTYGWNEYNDYIPANVTDIDGKIYFTTIRKNAGIDSTLLGAEILEIEDIPVKKYIEQYVYPDISASTDNHRWFQSISKLLSGRKDTYLKGRARKVDGSIVNFSIERNGETTRTPNDSYWVWAKETKQQNRSRINLTWDGEIAILNIRAFWPETLCTEIDSLASLVNEKAKGLVIDLRANGGGSSNVAEHLQMYLEHNRTFLSFGSQTRINDSYGRSQGNYRDEYKDFYLGKAYKENNPDTIIVDKKIKPFDCPVIILIGKYTFSAAEDFLVNIYEVPNRPLLIGEPTGGSTGAPLMVPLPHGALARICSLRILFPYSGKPFVGKGIQPDIITKQNVSDFLNGKDTVLDTAMKYFNSKN